MFDNRYCYLSDLTPSEVFLLQDHLYRLERSWVAQRVYNCEVLKRYPDGTLTVKGFKTLYGNPPVFRMPPNDLPNIP